MIVVAAAVLVVLLPLVLFDVARRPTIRRLALRNVVRRPGEAALVVGGALLATALITASFVIGDSFRSSIRNLAVERWGPVDEVVLVAGPDARDDALAIVEQAPDHLVDGAIGASLLDVPVASVGPGRHVAPAATVLEVDPIRAVTFAGDPDLFGPAPGRLDHGDVIVDERLAARLQVGAGDPVEVFLAGEPVRLEVAAVRPATGLAGLGQLLVVPGTLTERLDDPGAMSTSAVLVSNVGGVLDGAALTEPVIADLEDRLVAAGPGLGPFSIEGVKQDLLDDAELEAAEMTELFGTIGGFSVAAGILLVVNLFVMLAGERRAEMGTLRAIGLRRGHLVRAYSLEGAVYGAAAALVGVVLGIGVAAVVMRMAGALFDGELTLGLAVVGTSLGSGAVIGLAVSQITVLVTSWRVTRLNIVRAIRELPEPATAGHRRRSVVIGAAGVVSGTALYAGAGTAPIAAVVAPVVAAVSAVPILARFVPPRLAVALGCGTALAWVVTVFGLLPDVMDDPEIHLFLLQGVLLVGLATVIIGAGDRLWLAAARRVTGSGIASRVGMAEPLARPVRTGLLVAMYALVIFTVTFMAVMNAVFQAQAPAFAAQAGGGYDLYVDSHATSGLSVDELTSRADVASVAPVRRGWVTAGPVDEPERFDRLFSAITPSFLDGGPPALLDRAGEFSSDREAWAAVAGGEPYVIVDEHDGLIPGQRYAFIGDDGSPTILTVAGTTEQGWLIGTGFVIGDDTARELLAGDPTATRHYIDLVAGADPAQVADELMRNGVERGIDAETFLAATRAHTDEQEGFIRLLQGYLGLGLLIGIAGLGVVLVRAVRERRRQFGVMRALGIPSPVLGRALVVEASFVAVQGIVLGVGLGLLSSWQVLTRSSAIEDGLSFTVPTVALAALAVCCLAASLSMAAVPAIRAGRTTPADALRLTT